MKRKQFLTTAFGASIMTLGSIKALGEILLPEATQMPVLFIGHGSPMNGIEDNRYAQSWAQLAARIPRPQAIICISAHWLTRGTYVTATPQPETIHDFGGFPPELFAVEYPAPGAPALAAETRQLITKAQVGLDQEWGMDHGTWTILRRMYPEAQIPVLQLSIDYHQSPRYHYELAQELHALRKKGVLIIGSGNVVHNLGMVDFKRINDPQGYGFDWALEFDGYVKKAVMSGDHAALIDYLSQGKSAQLAVPTPDHYYPLLYAAGIAGKHAAPTIFNDVALAGSLTMTSIQWE
jgi:4,5-DOPA dioxygenase extradiol